MAVLAFSSILPHVIAIGGWAAWAAGAGNAWLATGIAATAAVAVQLSVIGRFYRLAGAKAALCWTYPLGCLVAMATLVRAYGLHRKGATSKQLKMLR